MVANLSQLLDEQIDFIRDSCERFDQGHEHEAKRIAVSVRVLVHDTSRSASLLGQLRIKDTLGFVDTAGELRPDPPDGVQGVRLVIPLGLVAVRFSGADIRFLPILNEGPIGGGDRVEFQVWWNRVLARSIDGEKMYRRKDFVLGAANKEGAHVDPEPEDWWIDLRDESYIGALKVPVGGGEGVPIGNLVPATIRQIGFEVLTTLDALDDAAGD